MSRFLASEFVQIKSVDCHQCRAAAFLVQSAKTYRWMMMDKHADAAYERGHYYRYHQCVESGDARNHSI